jgi:hypothetical protein
MLLCNFMDRQLLRQVRRICQVVNLCFQPPQPHHLIRMEMISFRNRQMSRVCLFQPTSIGVPESFICRVFYIKPESVFHSPHSHVDTRLMFSGMYADSFRRASG